MLDEDFTPDIINELKEVLTSDGCKICGYEATKELVEFLDRNKAEIIKNARNIKRREDRQQINPNQGKLV